MSNTYDVNYEDERFAKVEADKQQALTELDNTYNGMIDQSDQHYKAQIDASKDWAQTQSQQQQERTDFAIEQIEQQKGQARKDYVKEQSGAFVDWQKQSNRYGTEAERQASAGMNGTGFSESSQVSMYNTYQNRVATARESYQQAVLNYDNAIKDARMQNNAALAEIAYQSFQEQLKLSLDGFHYKNNLILEQANKKTELNNTYYNRFMDVLNQINQENAMAESIRQFNQDYELRSKQFDEQMRQFELDYELQTKQFNEGIRQFNEEIARLKAKDDEESRQAAAQLELQRQGLLEEQRQFDINAKLERERLEEEKRQFDQSRGSGVIKGDGGSSGSGTITINEQSVLELGYGPLSPAQLASLEAEGKIEKYESNGQYYFRRKDSNPITDFISLFLPSTSGSTNTASEESGSRNVHGGRSGKF